MCLVLHYCVFPLHFLTCLSEMYKLTYNDDSFAILASLPNQF